ncbi:MAG: ribosome-binding factor A [Candidatus Paceibacteria bacterium]
MQKRPLPYDRHDRATSLIKEVAASYIQREANTNPLITVTNATISPDYRRVTIFFTTIPDGRENDALIFLQRNAGELRHYLKQKTRLKIIPHLEFSVDYGERHRQHIDEIVRDNDMESTLPEETKPTK